VRFPKKDASMLAAALLNRTAAVARVRELKRAETA
jgi:hypothetical protein